MIVQGIHNPPTQFDYTLYDSMFANCIFSVWKTANKLQQSVKINMFMYSNIYFTAVVNSVPLDSHILSIDLSCLLSRNLPSFRTVHFNKHFIRCWGCQICLIYCHLTGDNLVISDHYRRLYSLNTTGKISTSSWQLAIVSLQYRRVIAKSRSSCALAVELRLSCINPSMFCHEYIKMTMQSTRLYVRITHICNRYGNPRHYL